MSDLVSTFNQKNAPYFLDENWTWYYWKDIIYANNEQYYMCCEWFEKENNNDRAYFENWLKTKAI